MAKADLTAQRLRELLDYDPGTGIFIRKLRTSRRIKVGDIAGSLRDDGYLSICLLNKTHLAHRLAWLYVHGVKPKFQIDHLNGIRADNRIENLRDVLPSVNQQNQRIAHRRNHSCGLLGVTWDARKKRWMSQISVLNFHKFVGYFDDPNEAHSAYLAAKRSLHAGCTI